MDTTSTSGIYVTYASLLVSVCAHVGFILGQNDAVAIVGGLAALVGTIYQHYQVSKNNAAGLAKGVMVK